MSAVERDLDIFEDRLGGGRIGFNLVLPGVMIGSTNVRVDFTDGQWQLTHADSVDLITVRDENKTAAMLKLVALRCGFEAEIRPTG